jgi:hypothetical protein
MDLQPFATPKKNQGIGTLHRPGLIGFAGDWFFFVASHRKEGAIRKTDSAEKKSSFSA